MTEDELAHWILTTPEHVDETMNDGNHFFFYNPPGFAPEHLLPFATIVTNNHYDDGSDLDRPGVYRLNIGVSRETFESLFPQDAPPVSDRTELDTFFPHPDYASMSWLSVINPATTWPRAAALLREAHAIAKRRVDRKHGHAAAAADGAVTAGAGDAGSAVGNAGSAVGDAGSAVGDAGSAVGDAGSAVGDAGSTEDGR